MDYDMGGIDGDIRLAEIEVHPHSRLAGTSLRGAGIGREVGVILIGIRRADGAMVFNPSADVQFHAHDILIGIGRPDQLEHLQSFV